MLQKLGMLVAFLLFASTSAGAQITTSSWVGTWTLDVSKSKLHQPAVQNETLTVQPNTSDTLLARWSASGTGADGKPISVSVDARLDGKAYPVMVNGQDVGTVSYTRHSRRVSDVAIENKDGTSEAGKLTMAADGKTFTNQEHHKTPQGEYDETQLWVKQ
jgi:hypothetical protein